MNKNHKVAVVVALVLSVVVARAWTVRAAEETNPFAVPDAQIIGEIRDHSELMDNLEYLSDRVGPRLTGSPRLKQANDWTAEMFKKYGLTNVHLEAYTIPHAWTRGRAEARIISPTEHPLTIVSSAWAPNTHGKVRGPVVYFDAKTPDDYAKFHGKLRGAIVIYQKPRPLSPPKEIDQNLEIYHPLEEPPPPPGQPAPLDPYEMFVRLTKTRMQFLKEEGVVAVLRDSDKPHGLLNMTDATFEPFQLGPLPSAFVTGEGYRMLYRMVKKGTVQMEVEISGTEKPDEMVILGAHLDSWDLATGSTDNGTGSMAVLEAARALAKLNLKPKRR